MEDFVKNVKIVLINPLDIEYPLWYYVPVCRTMRL